MLVKKATAQHGNIFKEGDNVDKQGKTTLAVQWYFGYLKSDTQQTGDVNRKLC